MASVARYCCCQKCPAALIATFANVDAAELCLDTGGGLPGSVKGTSLDVNGSHEVTFSSFDSSTSRCLYLGTITDGATITEYTAANDCTGATTVHVVDANVFIWYDRVTEKIDRLSLTAALGVTTFWIFGAPQQGGASDALAFDLGDAEPNVVLAANTRIGSGGTVTVDLP